jgi:hypothetical protein
VPETMKTRERPAIGTRVRAAHAKVSTMQGTVVGHCRGWSGPESGVLVHWDGRPDWDWTRRETCELMEVKS